MQRVSDYTLSYPSVVLSNQKRFNLDYPKPGETTRIDKSEQVDLQAPLNGGVLVKTIALSIDPYLRGRMRPEDVDTYSVCMTYCLNFFMIHLNN